MTPPRVADFRPKDRVRYAQSGGFVDAEVVGPSEAGDRVVIRYKVFGRVRESKVRPGKLLRMGRAA